MKQRYFLSLVLVFSLPLHAYEVGSVINVSLSELKPTQPSIGYDQVMYKLGRYQFDKEKQFDEICEAFGQKGVQSFSNESVPNDPSSFKCKQEVGSIKADMKTVVIAPDSALYLTDGHHTFNTFHHMQGGGLNFKVNVVVDGDYRHLKSMDQFWQAMVKDGNTWLYDINGETITPNELPTSLGIHNFDNDLYRSLMYFSRNISWDKPKKPVPFLEFYWSKELRKLTDADQYDLSSLNGYKAAIQDVSKHLLSINTDSVGGSGKSTQEMGILAGLKEKNLEKVAKPNGKLDYMLRFKASLSDNAI